MPPPDAVRGLGREVAKRDVRDKGDPDKHRQGRGDSHRDPAHKPVDSNAATRDGQGSQRPWLRDERSGRLYAEAGNGMIYLYPAGPIVPRPSYLPRTLPSSVSPYSSATLPGAPASSKGFVLSSQVRLPARLPGDAESHHAAEGTIASVSEINGKWIVSASDRGTQVRIVYMTGIAQQCTDPELFRSGVRATTRVLESKSNERSLFGGYHARSNPLRFFVFGKVFSILWVKSSSDPTTVQYMTGSNPEHPPQQSPFALCYFVVVHEGQGCCSALPITTYEGRGVGKPGLRKSEHGIIYTTKEAPLPLRTEQPERDEVGMCPQPIRIDCDDRTTALDPASRINFGNVHTIQHQVDVKSFGQVNQNFMSALRSQFHNVWRKKAFLHVTQQQAKSDTAEHGEEEDDGDDDDHHGDEEDDEEDDGEDDEENYEEEDDDDEERDDDDDE